MLKAGSELYLALEPIRPQRSRQFGVENFQSYWSIVLDVVGKVDSRHATAAELALDPVTAAEGFREGGIDCSHEVNLAVRR